MKEFIIKHKEIILYLIVGGLTTLVSLGTYYLLVFTVLDPEEPVQLQAATVIAWIAAVTFAYFANRIVVFHSHNPHRIREAATFYISRVGTLLIDMGLMFLGVTVLHFNDKVMKLVVQVLVMLGNYAISKLLVFRKKSEEKTGQEQTE